MTNATIFPAREVVGNSMYHSQVAFPWFAISAFRDVSVSGGIRV
jgi:hypothetical protein